MKLISLNVGGNLHSAATYCNKVDVSTFVLSISDGGTYNSIVILKVPDEDYARLCKRFGIEPEVPK